MTILNETQLQRDEELSLYSGIPIDIIKNLVIGAPESIKLYENIDVNLQSFDFIYKEFPHIKNKIHLLKTLSAFSVTRRGFMIKQIENYITNWNSKVILDFGCGVGTHGIYFASRCNIVDLLDVKGPLRDYAEWRCKNRKLNVNILDQDTELEKDKYDIVICLDVLEHIADPVLAFNRIIQSLKSNGLLLLEVSSMIKPTSGHFTKSINIWKQHGVPLLNSCFSMLQTFLYKKI